MGISSPDVPDLNEADVVNRYCGQIPRPGACCAWCMELVAHPCIYWSFPCAFADEQEGITSAVIYLHRTCAVSLVRSLLKDVELTDRLDGLARRLG